MFHQKDPPSETFSIFEGGAFHWLCDSFRQDFSKISFSQRQGGGSFQGRGSFWRNRLIVFSLELTLVRCFFFRGYIKVEVFLTLKNRHFSTVTRFLTVWAGCLRPIFCINKVSGFCCKNRKSYQKFKIMLESCQETSKLSADSFMAS